MWCVRFRQATVVHYDRQGKMPTPAPRRVIEELSLAQLARMLAGRVVLFLPTHTGAGPCGTLGRREIPTVPERCTAASGSASPIAWSVEHLIPPLQAYYEEKNRPLSKFSRAGIPHGARHGGGNGQSSYC